MIRKFTPKSMARLVATANATGVEFKSMLTLTYPSVFPQNGKTIKADMNHFLSMMRRSEWGEYLWFLEFQRRGAPHFHILSTQRAISPTMRIRVADTWVNRIKKSDWFMAKCILNAAKDDKCHWDYMHKVLARSYWFTLRPQTWEYLRDEDGARKYATMYATKEYQKVPPDDFFGVGRFWGCSSGVVLRDGIYQEMDERRLRNYLASTEHATAEWDRLPKYLFGVVQEVPLPETVGVPF